MKSFSIKSSFIQLTAYLILLVSVLFFCVIIANSQTANVAPTQSPSVDTKTEAKPLIILAPDVSISVKKSAEKMRSVLQQIVDATPENSAIGMVVVGTQSEKKVFSTHEEILSYISKISPNSNYTDLERGTDSILALMQEIKNARPTLVIYLTDGEVSLPKELTNKVDFKSILMREFTVRPDVRVLVLNVASKPMDTTGLPSNVTVVPLSNWEEAEKQMKQTLAVQIQQELKTKSVFETQSEESPVPSETKGLKSSGLFWLAVVGLSILTLAISCFWFWRRSQRSKYLEVISEEIKEPEPQNLLRPEELMTQSNEAPSLAAIIDFYDGKKSRLELLFARERCVIGKSMTADVKFSSLKQENSLELKFDGKQVSVFRLHPQKYNEVDEVWLNQVKAPFDQTIFHLQNSDLLTVGNIQISVKIVESSVAQIITEKNNRTVKQSFRSADKNESTKTTAVQHLNERKSRWN